ncbi:MAG: hypothetical protein L0219_14225 [Phycisphaerales bacterium]|nr:hypothetical protein [Phycisphaerales bacterium]MCI0676446.1 hypothetical protein [Phycisphaerales bacterium]
MPAGVFRRQLKHRPNRKTNPRANRPQPTTPIGIVSATKNVAVLTVVFNQPVTLKGIPAYTTNLAGINPISAVLTNPTTLTVTFSATIATATTLNIPYEEKAIRNSSGGFVQDSTFPVT